MIAALALVACGGLAVRQVQQKAEELLIISVTQRTIAAYKDGWYWQQRKEISPWHVNIEARSEVFDLVAGEDHGTYTEKWSRDRWQDWRSSIMEPVRAYLADPEHLFAMYMRHKDVMVQELMAAGMATAVKSFLKEEAIPAFTQPIRPFIASRLDEIRWLENEAEKARKALDQLSQAVLRDFTAKEKTDEYRRWRVLYDARWDARNSLRESLMASIGEASADAQLYLVPWRLRRHAEGGDELVATWGRIFVDLERSL